MDSDSLRHTYDHIAKDYAKDHAVDTWDNDYIKLFVNSLHKGAAVLDLGCGPGIETVKLAAFGLRPEGFDLSDEMLKIAKHRDPAIVFTQGSMYKLPYNDSSFDGVFAKASLLHVPKRNIPTVLDEIYRVVWPRGKVHIAIKGGDGEGELTENDYGYAYTRFFSYWRPSKFYRSTSQTRL